MDNAASGTRQKALALNLDATTYGTFAEIGGGQEVARPLEPLAALRKFVPFEAAASSARLGWVGLEAARYRASPASELNQPALTHHGLVLFARPPEELDLLYE